MAAGGSNRVFSTETGRHCSGCHRPLADCVCRDKARPAEAGDGIVRILRERKGRKGAGVTLINGLPLGTEELKVLAKQLKARCGVGGAVKDFVIELQGDQRDKAREILEGKGYRVKLAGG